MDQEIRGTGFWMLKNIAEKHGFVFTMFLYTLLQISITDSCRIGCWATWTLHITKHSPS